MSDKPKIKFKNRETAKTIDDAYMVRVTQMNHIVEVMRVEVESNAFLNYTKIDKYTYRDNRTGTVHQYKISENRAQNISSIKRTMKRIRHIINNNFVGASNELFITLSYAENMTDKTRLMKDFEKFIKKMKRRYPDIEYMSVVEPQGRGSWHCHVLVKFKDRERIYIDNNVELWPMWGHGFTKIKSFRNIDNIGAYLGGYMADLEVNEENSGELCMAMKYSDMNKLEVVEKEVEDREGNKVTKRYAKGARLHLYPPGMNLYRCSKGIIKPETEQMEYKHIKKIVGDSPPNYSRTIDLIQEDKTINSITYEQYNLKREKLIYDKG